MEHNILKTSEEKPRQTSSKEGSWQQGEGKVIVYNELFDIYV